MLKPPTEPNPDPIGGLRPWENAEKLHARKRLNNAALRSAARATNAQSPHARQLFWLINCVAAEWTFENVKTDVLTDTLRALNYAALAADTFERNGRGA